MIWLTWYNIHFHIYPVLITMTSQWARWRLKSPASRLFTLLNCLFRPRSKKTSKLRVTGLCAGSSPGTGEFPAKMASNAENVSIWWRQHVPSLGLFCPSLNDIYSSTGLFLTGLEVYHQVSNIRRTSVGNEIVDHSDVVGASPVGTAPTTSSFST